MPNIGSSKRDSARLLRFATDNVWYTSREYRRRVERLTRMKRKKLKLGKNENE